MKRFRLAAAALTTAVLMGLAGPVFAISLDAARAQGLVGETMSGYIAPVQSPSADVQALVNQVNAQRRAHYQSIAGRNGVGIEEVGRLTAEKIINGLPGGAFFQSANGAWRQK